MKGTKIGFKHKWNYKHNKTIDKGRKVTIYQTKKRSRKAPKGTGMPIGSKLIWNIKARMKTKKVPKGYIVTIKGWKGQGAYKLPKQKWKKTRKY